MACRVLPTPDVISEAVSASTTSGVGGSPSGQAPKPCSAATSGPRSRGRDYALAATGPPATSVVHKHSLGADATGTRLRSHETGGHLGPYHASCRPVGGAGPEKGNSAPRQRARGAACQHLPAFARANVSQRRPQALPHTREGEPRAARHVRRQKSGRTKN